MPSAEIAVRLAPVHVLNRRPLPLGEGPLTFVISLALYLVAAGVLVLGFHVVSPEALSHVGNAYYVLYSRDPHLAAIGFIWNPLPSLLMLAVLPLKVIWPAIVTDGLAASLVSAVFMAGSVYLVNRLLAGLALQRGLRLGLTALFGLHPLLLYVAAAGLPQAVFLFFLLLAITALAHWVAKDDLLWLIRAGIALGAAYLVTPAAVAAFAGAALFVAYQSRRRLPGSSPGRYRLPALDALVLAMPVFLAMATWGMATWLITGDPIHQISSIYAAHSQLQAMGTTTSVSDAIRRLLSLAPGLIGLAGLLAFGFIDRREPRLIAAIALLIPVLVLELIGQALGMVQTALSPLFAVVPLALLVAAGASSPIAPRIQRGIAVLMLSGALPLAAVGVVASGVLQPHVDPFAGAQRLAQFLDSRHLPPGSVLIDSYTGFPVILDSQEPRQFVITNDRDFLLALTDPAGMGVEYLVVPAPGNGSSIPSLDALARAYPGLYQSGAGLGNPIAEFPSASGGDGWRLYRVLVE